MPSLGTKGWVERDIWVGLPLIVRMHLVSQSDFGLTSFSLDSSTLCANSGSGRCGRPTAGTLGQQGSPVGWWLVEGESGLQSSGRCQIVEPVVPARSVFTRQGRCQIIQPGVRCVRVLPDKVADCLTAM